MLGALNLFRTEPVALSRADLATAQAFADVATIALLQSRALHDSQLIADQLQEALQSRIVIEQAKGILAQALGLEMDQAFARMRRHARSGERRLAEIAQAWNARYEYPKVILAHNAEFFESMNT